MGGWALLVAGHRLGVWEYGARCMGIFWVGTFPVDNELFFILLLTQRIFIYIAAQ